MSTVHTEYFKNFKPKIHIIRVYILYLCVQTQYIRGGINVIVRETKTHFILIQQHDHARLSGEIFNAFSKDLFHTIPKRNSVEYAIFNHDLGWNAVDKMPFWNDEMGKPYSFMNFPQIPKISFYREGIEKVSKVDAYAGLLCSRHYAHFILGGLDTEEARAFVQEEQERKDAYIEQFSDFNESVFEYHYGLLALCDNLSLYLCLNKPGKRALTNVTMFQDGIPTPPQLHETLDVDTIQIRYKNKKSAKIDTPLFDRKQKFTVPYKAIPKKNIKKNGLLPSYLNTKTEYETTHVQFKK